MAAEFHFRLLSYMPIENPSSVSFPDWTNPKGNFEKRILIAGSLRKFLLNETDAVNLPNVVESALIEAGAAEEVALKAKTEMKAKINLINLGNLGLSLKLNASHSERLDANSLISDFLYGFYLHGSPKRQQAAQDAGTDVIHVALAQWIYKANELLRETLGIVKVLHPDLK